MPARTELFRSRHLGWWFTAATLAPVIGLIWLGWRSLAQDAALEAQRARDQAADLAVAALQRRIAEAEEQLTTAARGEDARLPSRAALVTFSPDGVVGRGGVSLPFY